MAGSIILSLVLALLLPGCRTVQSDILLSDRIDPKLHPKDSITYALPTAYLKLVIDKPSADVPPTVTLTEEYMADPNHYYTLTPLHSPLALDTYNIKVDEKSQLLDSITNVHTDKTGDIVKNLVKLSTAGIRLAAGLGPNEAPGDRNLSRETYHIERHISFEEAIQGISFSQFYFRIQRIGDSRQQRVYCRDKPWPSKSGNGGRHSGENRPRKDDRVVYYKVGLPYVATLEENRGVGDSWAQIVNLPNESPIQQLNLTRGLLVKVEYTVDFTHGMPVQITSDRPSEVLAAVTLPVEALRLVSSALPLQLKLGQANQATALYTAEKDVLEAQSKLIDQRIALIEQLERNRTIAQAAPSDQRFANPTRETGAPDGNPTTPNPNPNPGDPPQSGGM